MRWSWPRDPKWEVDVEGKVYCDGEQASVTYWGGIKVGKAKWVKHAHIVCESVHGLKPYDKDVCAHRNDIPWDNRPANLYWATYSENARDARRNNCHEHSGNRGEYLRQLDRQINQNPNKKHLGETK